jgi:hypothetical protein
VGEFAGRVFMELVVQLVDLGEGAGEGSAAGGGDGVETALSASDVAEGGLEEAGALEAVEKGVESSGTDAVAVVGELFHHGEAEDGLVRGVGQHVDADEAEVEFALMLQHRINSTGIG